jgi:flagellar hook-length control protein FliK
MLQLSDIKITQKNCPEPLPAPQASKASLDNSSAASFFSILKNQLDVTGQVTNDLSAKPDMMKNSARAESAEKENTPRETTRQKGQSEETSPAESVNSEVAQKETAKTQNKEAKSAEAIKNADKKPVDAVQQKKTADVGAEPASRPARTQRAKKSGDTDMRELFDGLHRMMDVIKGKEQSDLRAARSGGRDAEDFMNGSRGKVDRNALKGLLDRLAAITKKIDAKNIPAAQAEHLTRSVAEMKNLLQKSRPGNDRGRGHTAATAPEPGLTAVKDLLARIESLLDGAKGEGPQNRQGGDTRGNGDFISLNHLKSDMQARRSETSAGPQKQSNFMEQVGHIIENAKVVVRDSRNGSFSVRLYPRELGSLNVSLGLENGIVHGKFLVESTEAKDLLMSNIEQIKQRLADAGIAVGEFQVDVNDRRGRMLRDAEHERDAVITPAERHEEIAVEYESNSKIYHDGHINLVI